MGKLSDSYQRQVRLAELERQRSELLAESTYLEDLEEQYRSARIQELTLLLLSENEWLEEKNWRCHNASTGRELSGGDRNDGCGVILHYLGGAETRRKASSVVVEFPYETKMYRVDLDGKEDDAQQFFFAKEVVARIGELIFEREQLTKDTA